MNEELSEDNKRYFEVHLCELWDLYVLTQGGVIRRVSMPNRLWAHTVWLMRENTDVEPEFFDKQACEWASRENCGYAEALRDLIDQYFDREEVCAAALPDMTDNARFDEIKAGFKAAPPREVVARSA